MTSNRSELDADCPVRKRFEPPGEGVLKTCGRLMFDTFLASRTTTSSLAEPKDAVRTHADAIMDRWFDRLYDVMSGDLRRAHVDFRSRPKSRLYDDLGRFTSHGPLLEINRYVFGNGPPNENWGTDYACALKTMQIWSDEFEDKTKIPECLVETYMRIAKRQELDTHDVSMVAFAVFGFMQGYDTKIDFDLLFMFCRIDDVCKPVSFQQTYNFVVRHVITFLESSEYEKHANFFDSLVEKPDVVTMFKWIFNLLIETPDAVEIFTTNPFSYELGVSVKMENIIGRTLLPSYVVQLRIFYKWISNELYLLFTGNGEAPRLNRQMHTCLCSLNETSWVLLFDDAYVCVLRHCLDALNTYNCPEEIIKQFCATWADEDFKGFLKFLVGKRIDFNSTLTSNDKATVSANSDEYLSDYS